MLTVNVGKEQVYLIVRDINRALRKYEEYEFKREEEMSEESHREIISFMVMQDLREVTSYVCQKCFMHNEERQWIETTTSIRESLKHDGVIDVMKNNVAPICADFCEKLNTLVIERDKILLKDGAYKPVNTLGGITTHHSEVITLDCMGLSQYMTDVLNAVMRGVKNSEDIKLL